MADKLRQLFRIHKGEEWKVLHFAILGALLQAGIAIGVSTSDSLFIVHITASKLPYVYIWMLGVMLVFTGVYAWIAGRAKVEFILIGSLLLLMMGCAFFYDVLFLNPHPARIIYYLAKFFSGLWFIGLYTIYWNFTDNYFDLQDAKRLYPVFSGGGATGAMIGGFLVERLAAHLQVAVLYLAWLILGLLALIAAYTLAIRWNKIEADEDESDDGRGGFRQIADTFAQAGRSTYVKVFLLLLFLGVVLNTLDEYQYLQIFQFHGISQYAGYFALPRSEKEVAEILGGLFMWVNVLNLVVNFFVFNRLVTRVGVGNVALIGPAAYLFTFLYLLMKYGLLAGKIGFFAYQGVITSIDWNNANFLFNAVPTTIKARVRTFAEGLIEPIATAAAGVFLLVAGKEKWLPDQISVTGVIIAAVYFVLALAVRSGYLGAMVANLKEAWLDFSKPEGAVLSGLDPEELTLLKGRACSHDLPTAHSAIKVLWANDRESSVECLLQVMSRGKSEMEASVPLLDMVLMGDDPAIARLVREWADDVRIKPTPAVVEELGEHGLVDPQRVAYLLNSEDAYESAAAVIASWDTWTTEDHRALDERVWRTRTAASPDGRNSSNGPPAFARLIDLMHSGTMGLAAALRAIGRSRYERHAHYLTAYFQDPDTNVRREAQTAVHRLATPDTSRVVPDLLRAIAEGTPEERELDMETLAKIGGTECIIPLLEISPRFSPYERRKLEMVLRDIGLKAVPATVAVVLDQAKSYMARSISARALAQISSAQLESISQETILTEIRRSYEYFYFRTVLEQSVKRTGRTTVGMSVLTRFYRDMQSTVLDFVLEVLSVGGRLPDFELISASLQSTSGRDRGNAIEAIEQGVDRKVFQLLLPLIDLMPDPANLTKIGVERLGIQARTEDEIIEAALSSSSPIEAAAAAQAIRESKSGEAGNALRRLLRESNTPMVRETAVSLLAGPAAGNLNLIQRLYILSRTGFLGQMHIRDLAIIANLAQEVAPGAGSVIFERGNPADSVYVIVSGSVKIDGDVLSAAGLFGTEGITGQALRQSGATAVDTSCRLLRVAANLLLDAARTYPSIAMTLLAKSANTVQLDEGRSAL